MTFARSKDITVRIQDQKTGEESRIRIDVSLQLKKLIDLYCNMKSVDPNSFVFSLRGCPLNAHKTLDQLQMNDGDKIEAFLQQRASYKDKAVVNQNPRSFPVDPGVHLETKRDNVLPVWQQLQESRIDMSLRHQQEQFKQFETKVDLLLSVQHRQQSEIDILHRHPEEHGKQLETKMEAFHTVQQQQQQSQINTVLCQQHEHNNQLETKIDQLDFIQQQQQKQIDTLLRQQQDNGTQLAAIASLLSSLNARSHQTIGNNDGEAMDEEEKHVHVDGKEDVDSDGHGSVGSDEDGLFVLV